MGGHLFNSFFHTVNSTKLRSRLTRPREIQTDAFYSGERWPRHSQFAGKEMKQNISLNCYFSYYF